MWPASSCDRINFEAVQFVLLPVSNIYLLRGEELRAFKNMVEDFDLVGKNANQLYLWTRRGASRHCKMLGTDKAWEQFDALEENYYNLLNN